MGSGTVTPITTVTNTPGPAISVGLADSRATSLIGIAITPDGRTVYVLDSNPPYNVVPISTATDRAAKPISVGPGPRAIAITPDGKAAYVACSSDVTPVALATDQAGAPIKVPSGVFALVIVADAARL